MKKKTFRGSDKVRTKRCITLEDSSDGEYEPANGCPHHQPHRCTWLRRDNTCDIKG